MSKEVLSQNREQQDAISSIRNENDDERRARELMLRGKSLVPEGSTNFNQEAFDLLQEAVRLDPSLSDAWLELANCYRLKLDIEGATNCLEEALRFSNSTKDPNYTEILRRLSICIRKKKCYSQQDQINTFLKSLEVSKECVKLDLLDEENYYNLAKAYMCLFFVTECIDQQLINLSKSAYSKALTLSQEKYSRPNDGDTMINTKAIRKPLIKQADFFVNFSSLLVYLQEFQKALDYLQSAITLDDAWDDPKQSEECLVDYLKQIYLTLKDLSKNNKKLIKKYGKVVEPLNNVSKIEQIILLDQQRFCKSGLLRVKPVLLKDIEIVPIKNANGEKEDLDLCQDKEGIQETNDSNLVKLLHLKPIGLINYNQSMYLTFIAIDRDYSLIVLTIYNLAASRCPTPKDVITVVNPEIELIEVSCDSIKMEKTKEYPSVLYKRINVRGFKSFYVNGCRISKDQVSRPEFKVGLLP